MNLLRPGLNNRFKINFMELNINKKGNCIAEVFNITFDMKELHAYAEKVMRKRYKKREQTSIAVIHKDVIKCIEKFATTPEEAICIAIVVSSSLGRAIENFPDIALDKLIAALT